MRTFLALFLALALPLGAAAQQRHYAILSLVGDELTIVQREMGTGSRIDQKYLRVERFTVCANREIGKAAFPLAAEHIDGPVARHPH